MSRDKLLYGVDYMPTIKDYQPRRRDIICPECGGTLEDKDKVGKWTSSPINLVCNFCKIEWVI